MYESAQRVIAFLDMIDPAEAARARQRYSALEPFQYDHHAYGRVGTHGHPFVIRTARLSLPATGLLVQAMRGSMGAQESVTRQLGELNWNHDKYIMAYATQVDPREALDAVLDAEMNAEVSKVLCVMSLACGDSKLTMYRPCTGCG